MSKEAVRLFVSLFVRDIKNNKQILLQELGLERIEDLPIISWEVITGRYRYVYNARKSGEETLYEAALLYYLLKKYGTGAEREEDRFIIKPFMAAEALLFYLPEGGRGCGITSPRISNLFDIICPVVSFEYEPDH